MNKCDVRPLGGACARCLATAVSDARFNVAALAVETRVFPETAGFPPADGVTVAAAGDRVPAEDVQLTTTADAGELVEEL